LGCFTLSIGKLFGANLSVFSVKLNEGYWLGDNLQLLVKQTDGF
jgi:hypothetical protein